MNQEIRRRAAAAGGCQTRLSIPLGLYLVELGVEAATGEEVGVGAAFYDMSDPGWAHAGLHRPLLQQRVEAPAEILTVHEAHLMND